MQNRWLQFWRELAALWAPLALLALCGIPVEIILQGPTFCLFRRWFDMECYGCGLTRALSFFAHGEIAIALSYNRLALLFFPALCFLAIAQVWLAVRRWQSRRRDRSNAES